MSTYQSLPECVEGETLLERLAKLQVWMRSMDGFLYSIGAGLGECRKEITAIQARVNRGEV